MSNIIKRKRTIDTFPTREMSKIPETRSSTKDINRYSIQLGYGLELRKRKERKNTNENI